MAEEESQAQNEGEQESAPEMTPEERQALIDSIKARIQSGEVDAPTFHRFVQNELYPLLEDGVVSQETFTDLVQAWAKRNYPYDWILRTYG